MRLSLEQRRLAAESDIRHQLATYCRGVDRCDADLIRSVYHDDAWEDHGDGYRGDPDGYAVWVVARLRTFVGTMHALQQSRFAFNADTTAARVETYCVARHQFTADGELMMETLGVRYLDKFELREGMPQWRIAHRIVVLEWHHVSPITPLSELGRGLASPRRDLEDYSYLPELPVITNG